MKNKWIYGLAIIFGLLTTYFFYQFLVSIEKKVTTDLTEEVICVAYDIPPKTQLTRIMLVKKNVPEEYIHPNAVRTMEEAVGAISLTSFVEGEQLLKSKLVSRGDTKNGLAYLIPEGERAMSLSVDQVSGVAGLIKPGDRVDVAAVISLPLRGQEETSSAIIVLQDIVILAVGKNMNDNSSKTDSDSSAKQTVTLSVTLQEAQELFLACQKGVIRLLLRSPVDNDPTKTVPFEVRNFVR